MIDWDLLVVLDRSGSMQSARTDHEGGLRSFVEDQRTLGGDVRFTLVQFDSVDPCEVVYDRVPLADVLALTLTPRGGTPLLDAVGRAVAHLRGRQALAPAARTLVLIITDGEENSSTEWTRPRVKALLAEVEAADGQVLFLGANIDAFADAGALGIAHTHAINFLQTPASVAATYTLTSDKLLRSRGLQQAGASSALVSEAMNYTDSDRAVVRGTVQTSTTQEP